MLGKARRERTLELFDHCNTAILQHRITRILHYPTPFLENADTPIHFFLACESQNSSCQHQAQ